MSKQLKVGIAGFGLVGKKRFKQIENNRFLINSAVCDINFSGSGTLPNGVRYYDTYKHLLKDEVLDILFISLPNYLAPEVIISALEKGLHVFCEKPPAADMKGMEKVRKTHLKYPNLKVKFGFNHRYHDSVQLALKLIKEQKYGNIINIRGIYGKSFIINPNDPEITWRSEKSKAGGGILLDQGIHMVDLIRLFSGEGEYDQIFSLIDYNFWNYDVEDNAYVLMKNSKSGSIAMLHSSATEWSHTFNLSITLTKGKIVLSGILTNSKSYGSEKIIINERNKNDQGVPRDEVYTFINDNSWCLEIEDFVDSIINDKPVSTGGVEDACRTLKLVFDIYNSEK